MEEWKPFPLNTGYSISTAGRILGPSGRITFGSKNDRGYYNKTLKINGKPKSFKVHRMVMLTFIGSSELEVNHINGNKSDNRLENLEYVSRVQNLKHAFSIGLMSNKGVLHPKVKLTEQDVLRIKESKSRTCVLAREYGVNWAAIKDIRKGKNWKHVNAKLESEEETK